MVSAPRQRQKGVSFTGFVVIVALVVAVFAIAGQSLPILLEYQVAKKAISKIASHGGTDTEIRQAFDRAAYVDSIHAIAGQDLEIRKVDGHTVIGFAYERDIPLVGSAYLVYRFQHQTN